MNWLPAKLHIIIKAFLTLDIATSKYNLLMLKYALIQWQAGIIKSAKFKIFQKFFFGIIRDSE